MRQDLSVIHPEKQRTYILTSLGRQASSSNDIDETARFAQPVRSRGMTTARYFNDSPSSSTELPVSLFEELSLASCY